MPAVSVSTSRISPARLGRPTLSDSTSSRSPALHSVIVESSGFWYEEPLDHPTMTGVCRPAAARRLGLTASRRLSPGRGQPSDASPGPLVAMLAQIAERSLSFPPLKPGHPKLLGKANR